MIQYKRGNAFSVEEMVSLYKASTLGERRPVDDVDRMQRMLQNANLVITAWDGLQLVGIARSVSDYVYATYLSDLVVRDTHQRDGIGKELIRRTQLAAPQARIILISAPLAVGYYPHIGFTQHMSAWTLAPDEKIHS